MFQQQQKAKDKERGPKSIRRNVAQSGTDEDEEAGSVAAMRICNTVQDQIKEFKVGFLLATHLCFCLFSVSVYFRNLLVYYVLA